MLAVAGFLTIIGMPFSVTPRLGYTCLTFMGIPVFQSALPAALPFFYVTATILIFAVLYPVSQLLHRRRGS